MFPSHIVTINTLTDTARAGHCPSFADCMFTSSSRSDMLSQQTASEDASRYP